MSTDPETEAGTHSLEELVEADLENMWSARTGHGTEVYYSKTEEDSSIGAVKGISTDFESAADSFDKVGPGLAEKLVRDFEGHYSYSHLALYLPNEIAPVFEGGDGRNYGSAVLYLDGITDPYTVKTRPYRALEETLEGQNFNELYDHLESSFLSEGEIIAVHPRGLEGEGWSSRGAILLSDHRSIMASFRDTSLAEKTAKVSTDAIMERTPPEEMWHDLKRIEVYPDEFDQVEVVETEDGAAVRGDGEIIEVYEGYTIHDRDVGSKEEYIFDLVEDQE